MNTITILILLLYIASAMKHFDYDTQFRVVGGDLVPPGGFPFAVTIRRYYSWSKQFKHICTGSIIDRNWILTAAHCLINKELWALVVVVGTNNVYKERGSTHQVKKIYFHPGYQKRHPIIENDVGLILLKKPLTNSFKIKPIKLGLVRNDRNDVIALGWGRTHGNSRTSDDLRFILLKILNFKDCQHIHRGAGNIVDPKTHICVWGGSGKTLCHGDSGSPLVDLQTGNQIGIFSGLEDCTGEYPALYMKVSVYFPWISNIMRKMESYVEIDRRSFDRCNLV